LRDDGEIGRCIPVSQSCGGTIAISAGTQRQGEYAIHRVPLVAALRSLPRMPKPNRNPAGDAGFEVLETTAAPWAGTRIPTGVAPVRGSA
jgi:hypothetical protein